MRAAADLEDNSEKHVAMENRLYPMRELLGDRERLARMGVRAREATARFSDDLHARDMLDIYERVLGQQKPDPAALVASLPPRHERVRPHVASSAPRVGEQRRRLAGASR